MHCSIRARVASHCGLPTHTSCYCCAQGWCAVTSRKGEEPGTTPGRAGDGARDGREARIRRPLPVESIGRDGDGVALALIVANQHRAGFEVAPRRAAVARQTVQKRQAFTIEAAEGLLLNAPADHSPQEVLAQSRRRRSSEDHPPAPPKGIGAQRPETRDLSLDRGRVRLVLPHGPTHSADVRCRQKSCQQRSDTRARSEEHTSELQSLAYLVCR